MRPLTENTISTNTTNSIALTPTNQAILDTNIASWKENMPLLSTLVLMLGARILAIGFWFACYLGCKVVGALLVMHHWVGRLQQDCGFRCSTTIAKR